MSRRLSDRDVDQTFKKAGFSSAKDFFGMLWVGSIDEDGRPAGKKKD